MTTGTRQIAAENQRRRIPDRWLIEFDGMTNAELAWFAEDQQIKAEVRSYCGWELEYREEFGISVYIDPNTAELVRSRR